MIEIVICSAAQEEYAEALKWYLEKNVDVAERFDAELARLIDIIASYPQRYPFCDERHQFCLMRRFPYQVIYRVDLDRAVVIAIAHTSREPNYWSSR